MTEYRVVCEKDGRCIVLASPITGRTHQIRVQFSSIGCPVTGDSLYGSESPYIERHALHSWKTVFPHPQSGDEITVKAPIPEDIAALISALGLSFED